MEFLTYAVQLDLNMQALLHLRYFFWFELKIWKATCFSPNYRISIVWQIIYIFKHSLISGQFLSLTFLNISANVYVYS
jgi:hypothetical protein